MHGDVKYSAFMGQKVKSLLFWRPTTVCATADGEKISKARCVFATKQVWSLAMYERSIDEKVKYNRWYRCFGK